MTVGPLPLENTKVVLNRPNLNIKSEDEYVSKMMNYYSIAGAINNAAISNMDSSEAGIPKQENYIDKIG